MKYLALIMTFSLLVGLNTTSHAHRQTRAHTVYDTHYGSVSCLNHEGVPIDPSFCNDHSATIGSQPTVPQIQCPRIIRIPVSHEHESRSGKESEGGDAPG